MSPRLALIVTLTLAVATPRLSGEAAGTHTSPVRPRNVILFIGDGFGRPHAKVMCEERQPCVLSSFPVRTEVSTRTSNGRITDSAAGGTAIATGHKTMRHRVAVDGYARPLRTATEAAASRGMATGIVTTAKFWDATPAVFAAHSRSRYAVDSVILQMLASEVDIITGSGVERFKNNRNLLETMAARSGRKVVDGDLGRPSLVRQLRLFPSHPKQLDPPGTTLAHLTRETIDALDDDPDGFFLVVEHEGIDTASHDASIERLRIAVGSLHDAITVGKAYADVHPDTLVLVTADHETGTFHLQPDGSAKWTFTEHTGSPVPLYAFGPGASNFGDARENRDTGRKLLDLIE